MTILYISAHAPISYICKYHTTQLIKCTYTQTHVRGMFPITTATLLYYFLHTTNAILFLPPLPHYSLPPVHYTLTPLPPHYRTSPLITISTLLPTTLPPRYYSKRQFRTQNWSCHGVRCRVNNSVWGVPHGVLVREGRCPHGAEQWDPSQPMQ